jgi:PAS domain S-box-containing protein
MKYPLDRADRLTALRIIAIYVLFAALWIYLSDEILGILVRDPAIIVRISVFKGFLFIVVTSALLYQLIVRQIQKTRGIEKELRVSEKRYRSLFENMQDSYAHCRMIFQDGVPVDYKYLAVNPAFERFTGLKDVLGKRISDVIPGYCRDNPESLEIFGRVARTGKPESWEHYLAALDIWYSFVIYCPAEGEFVAVCEDITERKRGEEAREATIELLRVCNEADSKRELMRELTGFFHNLTGCEAVGVRLKEGEDFPYYETSGFAEEFVKLENSLCAFDQAGEMVRNNVGHPAYACMCGNILSGRFDPSKPFFTRRGSFWSSCTTELLASTTDGERQTKTLSRCNGEGYESVALVPLRSHGETFGLFQFNDRRRGRFTAEKIALYEDLVAYVAIALAKMRVDEALLESSQFNRQVINSAEEGIIVYGRDMRYLAWNPFMERLSGKKADEVIGRHPLEIFPFLRETGVIENIRKALSGQTLASVDFPFQSSQIGLICWISDTCVPLRNTKGEIIGVIGTVLDITERKLAQAELKEVTQRLRLATAAGHLGIWDWDIVNDVLIWNERMFELYEVSPDTFRMSREKWEKSLHPDDLALALEKTRAALSGEKEYDFEFRIVLPDGKVKFIKSNAMIIRDGDGKAIRMIGMNQDITERKQMEEQLRHSQKMEAIGQLAGGVAHDFNNILTAIYGHCSVLQMKIGKDAPFRSDIDQIYAAAERAANLTRSLLAFSRKQIMSPKTVNLNEVVSNVGKLLTRIIGEDIELKIVLSANPLNIFGDRGQVEQVLMNLAANARDAMPNGGILTIETELQAIDESFIHAYGYGVAGQYAVISVSDTGKGMNAETSNKIFEPFFTTKEVGKGTGLGLSIVYGVVKQHNGYINVYSEPDKGTVFRIYFPQVFKEHSDDEEETVFDFPKMGTETVLVAEDDASIRELANSVLTNFGYEVILAVDGMDAVEKFKTNYDKIAIIIMDMIMPGKSGKEAYEEIRKIRPDVRILFVSGYSPDLLQDRGILDNREEVLIKPIHPLDLVRKVQALLDSVKEIPRGRE